MRIMEARTFADSGAMRSYERTAAKSLAPGAINEDAANIGAAEAAERQDCRAKIYAILACVQFESSEALTIPERQHMELVKLYPESVQLETWIAVKENIESRNLKPVSADLKWIQDSIAMGKEQTSQVQSDQQRLANDRYQEDQESLRRFYDDIRTRAQFRRGAGGGKDGVGYPAGIDDSP
jgi:hypothetical protein